MIRTKDVKGITLIALVITIIVLLIIAGVSIALLIGENGVLTRLEISKKETEDKQMKEQIKLAVVAAKMNDKHDLNIDIGILESELKNNLGNDVEINKADDDKLPWEVTKGDYTFKITEDGKVVEEGEEIYLPKDETGLSATDIKEDAKSYYGKYVSNYEVDLNGNGNLSDDWRIFHADENIYLIAGYYVTNDFVPDASEDNTIYDNGNGYQLSMDNIYKEYADSAAITSSNPAKKWLNQYYTYNTGAVANENIRATAYMLDTTLWMNKIVNNNNVGEIAKSKTAYIIGGPTLELFVASYNKTREEGETKLYTEVTSSLGYSWKLVENEESGDYNTNTIKIQNPKSMEDLYYISTSISDATAMWIASPSKSYNSNIITTDCASTLGNCDYTEVEVAFRPVVCLDSEVLLEENPDGTTYRIK